MKLFRKFALLLILAQWMAASASAAPADVGTVLAVKNDAVVEKGNFRQALSAGTAVHQDETIVTGPAATAEIELLDKTKLAVGPGARIVLERFVYDAGSSNSISINLSKGAFRFLTGLAPKESYEIRTPAASLGVRGTVFDIYVGGNGETAVLLLEGAVQACNVGGFCRVQDRTGTIYFVGTNGVISEHSKCENLFIPGVKFANAFPFVGKTLVVDPVRRLALRDFECRPAGERPINAGTPPSSSNGSPPSPTEGIPPPEILGIVAAGGLITGITISESKPASP